MKGTLNPCMKTFTEIIKAMTPNYLGDYTRSSTGLLVNLEAASTMAVNHP